MFSRLKLIITSTKIYYIRHTNFRFNQFYNNGDIYSTVYINQQFKKFVLTNTIASHSKQWRNEGSTYIYNNNWRLDGLFIISFHFYSTILYSPNMSFSHHIYDYFTVCNHFYCFIYHNSQLARFLTWQILIFFNCVQ